jgi:WD40 repeat protein
MVNTLKYSTLLWMVAGIAGLRAADHQNPSSAKPQKLDLYGDPLPPGAIARIGSIRLRHAGLSDLVYLPDGKTILSAGSDRVLRWWDLATGKPMRTVNLQGDSGPGFCQTLSPDGKTLVAQDGQALVFWECATGKELKKLPLGLNGSVHYLYFSPDGKTLAVHANPATVSLWDWVNGKELVLKMPVGQNGFMGIDSTHHGYFSRDGKFFGTGGGIQHPVILWEVGTGKEIRRCECAPTISTFSPDGKFVAAACMNAGGGAATFRLFETGTGKEIIQKGVPQQGFFWWVDVSPDSKTIAFVDQQSIYLVDRDNLKEQRRIPGSVRQVFFSADGKWLMGNQGNRIRLWEVSSGKQMNSPGGLGYGPSAMAVSPDGRKLALGAWGDPVTIWELQTGKQQQLMDLAPDDRGVQGLSFSTDGKTLFAGTSSGHVFFWDTATGKKLRTVQLTDPAKANPNAYFQQIHLASDGPRVVALERTWRPLGQTDQLANWDIDTGKITKQFTFPANLDTAWSPDGKTAASLGQDGLTLMDLTTGQTLAGISGKWNGKLAMSPDSSLLAARATPETGRPDGGGIVIWETTSGKKVADLPAGPAHGWVLAGDNRTVVTIDARFIRVWDLASRAERYHLEMPKSSNPAPAQRANAPRSAAIGLTPILTADGRQITTVEPEGTLLIWDLRPPFRSNGKTRATVEAEQIAGWWEDLAKPDPAVAYAAIWKLTDASDDGVALLRKHLKPAVDADFDKVRKLIKELDDDSFEVREKASRELEKMGSGIQPAVQHFLEGRPPPEVRRRLEALVQSSAAVSRSPELLRRLRAIGVLERIATKDARQLLTTLAGGVPHAPETQAAKTALERMTQRVEKVSN